MALGEEPAAQLGIDVERVKRILLGATSLMVGAAVSVSGLIGFVGLIIPHLLRLLFGPDHRLLVPAAALGGAAFLVLCDTVARTLLAGRELPVGAITAVVGGPLFLILLRRHHARALAR
jgi:iron complex transport system permease protein